MRADVEGACEGIEGHGGHRSTIEVIESFYSSQGLVLDLPALKLHRNVTVTSKTDMKSEVLAVEREVIQTEWFQESCCH